MNGKRRQNMAVQRRDRVAESVPTGGRLAGGSISSPDIENAGVESGEQAAANRVELRAGQVPAYKQCPRCWGNLKGVGIRAGTYAAKRRTYYKCNCCGHDWTVDAKVTVEVLSIDSRPAEELSER